MLTKKEKLNQLYNSIMANDLDKIKRLVKKGLDLRQENDKGFLIACYSGSIKIIDYFLNNGADINASSSSYFDDRDSDYSVLGNGLSLAIDNSQWDAVDYLLEKGIKTDLDKSLALGRILFKKDFAKAKKLIDTGASVKDCNILITACVQDQWDIVKYLITETDANIHENEDFVLRNACNKSNFEMVKLLIAKGANINAIPDKKSNTGYPPYNDVALTHVIFRYNWDMFNYLIENGADPNVNNQDPFKQASFLMYDYPDIKKFVEHYIEKEYVVFNDDIFSQLVKNDDLEFIKFFLTKYPKKDIDEVHILDNKVIYNLDNTDIFDYFLSNGYEVSEDTRNMLVEERKDNFLQILLNYDLNKELNVSDKVSKKVKI